MFYSEAFLLNIGHPHLSAHRLSEQHRNISSLAVSLPHDLPTYGIDTDLRQAHLLGQIYVESGYFSTLEENLNYSKKGFHRTFHRETAKYDYWEQAERECIVPGGHIDRARLAGNTAYSDRMGNADYLSDEGYRFRGRGFIQVTGKDNYAAVSQALGIDFVADPDKMSDPRYALLSACSYWRSNGLNAYADRDDFVGLTHAINGGVTALNERKAYTMQIKRMQKTWNEPITSG